MKRDARRMRGERPFGITDRKEATGLGEVVDFIGRKGGLAAAAPP